MKPSPIQRRRFLQQSSLAAAAVAFPWVARRNVYGANNRLNVAAIGAGGKGSVDIGYCDAENVVALCDVDDSNAAQTYKKFPKAKQVRDFRVLLERDAASIDAVTISTPDHTHFHAAVMAMKLRKHVYLQKPLTHSIWEARQLTQLAQTMQVTTQMGNQGRSDVGTRRLVELVRSGILGTIKEIHVWTDRPIWPQGIARPATLPVPAHLDWDLWLGPAPLRPFHDGCVPFKWRAFWDFGTGALGDMGCHNMDLAFFALGLRDPIAVEATASDRNEETAPQWSIIHYDFAKGEGHGPLRVTWYDGGKKPNPALVKRTELPGNGYVFVGSKDSLYVPSYWGRGEFLSGAKMDDFASVPQTIPRWPGAEKDNDAAHHHEWLAACKGQGQASSRFELSGPMTEAVLLGNVAMRVGKRIEWNARELRATNAPEAASLVRRAYRKGWEIEV